jgi:hypothetical protein
VCSRRPERILLLFALNTPNIATADSNGLFGTAEARIHLWYSAFIPMAVLSMMRNAVKPRNKRNSPNINGPHKTTNNPEPTAVNTIVTPTTNI